MRNKKIKYKDLCQMVQEQKDQIKELEQTVQYIQNNYFCNTPFQAKIFYSITSLGVELRISYLKNGKINTITYTLQNNYLPFPKIKEIVKQSDVNYIITLQRTKDYYEYYAVDTFNWTIFDVTSLVKSNDKLTGVVKTTIVN